jgi:hypothetical protein
LGRSWSATSRHWALDFKTSREFETGCAEYSAQVALYVEAMGPRSTNLRAITVDAHPVCSCKLDWRKSSRSSTFAS